MRFETEKPKNDKVEIAVLGAALATFGFLTILAVSTSIQSLDLPSPVAALPSEAPQTASGDVPLDTSRENALLR